MSTFTGKFRVHICRQSTINWHVVVLSSSKLAAAKFHVEIIEMHMKIVTFEFFTAVVDAKT